MTAVRLPPPRVVSCQAAAQPAEPAVKRCAALNVNVLDEKVHGARAALPHVEPVAAPFANPRNVRAPATNAASALFRHQALHAYQRGTSLAAPLRVVPLGSTLLLITLALAVVAALLVACLGKVELTSRGRGVLRAREGVQPVIFETGGIV